MRTHVIASVGHVALQVKDLDGAVEHATSIMGLRESSRTGDRVDLTEGRPHHSLTYVKSDVDAVDHFGLEAAGPEAVAEIRRRLAERGVPLVSEGPLDDVLEDGLAFEIPGGFLLEVYSGMPKDEPQYTPSGVRPLRFGHLNFAVEDPDAMIELLCEVLDFRVSDRFRGGAFLRCNVEHHGIGVLKGENKLAHHAWEVDSIAELARLGDVLDDLGSNLLAGPVRHGMGNNIAAYMAGPGNVLVEYYSNMLKIWDDSTYKPGEWAEDGFKWFSRWSPGLPGPEARELALPAAPRGALSST